MSPPDPIECEPDGRLALALWRGDKVAAREALLAAWDADAPARARRHLVELVASVLLLLCVPLLVFIVLLAGRQLLFGPPCREQAVVTLSPDVTALDCRAAQIEIVESQAGTFLAWCKCSNQEGTP